MKISRFLRRATLTRRQTHLAVVVLANEAAAFQSYRLLHYHGISPEHLAIVGEGYSSPERVGLMQPTQIAARKARSYAAVSSMVGAVVCLVVLLFGKIDPNLILIVVFSTGILSGICGGVMGALFGFLGEGSTASIYRHHLNQGRYLLMMEGPEQLVRWGQEVLSHYSAPSPH
ncbi:MAG: hypothetical protein WCA35_21475 [Kovacikia sp.]